MQNLEKTCNLTDITNPKSTFKEVKVGSVIIATLQTLHSQNQYLMKMKIGFIVSSNPLSTFKRMFCIHEFNI